MRIRRSLIPLALLAATAAFAPAAFGATPSADVLLAHSATALSKKDSLHLTIEAHTTSKTDGTLTPAQAKKLVQPVEITASGDLSPSTVVLAAKMSADGQDLAGELRMSGNELYVNLLGTWYGTKSASSKGSGLSLNVKPKQLTGSLGDILRTGIDATVSPGPEVDGVATWKVTGSFEGAALAKALKSTGATANAKDVMRLGEKADVTVLIGRDDELPRRIEVVTSLGGADLATASSTTQGLVPLPKSGTKGLKSVTVTVVVGMSKFGQKVAFERPAKFKPLEKLIDALLGGLGSAKTTTTK